MSPNLITGGCSCGAIRYRAVGPIRFLANCHCGNCRRAVGAQAVAWVIVDQASFEVISGRPSRHQTETGAWRTFCGICGTSLTYESPKRTDQIDLTTGSLDQPELFPPKEDAFPEERLTWVPRVAEAQESGIEKPSNQNSEA